jgi:hypothetical protein
MVTSRPVCSGRLVAVLASAAFLANAALLASALQALASSQAGLPRK